MFCLLILSVSLNHADLLILFFLLQFFLFGSCISFSLFLTSVDKKKRGSSSQLVSPACILHAKTTIHTIACKRASRNAVFLCFQEGKMDNDAVKGHSTGMSWALRRSHL